MTQNKKRPKCIEDLIKEVNHEMWNRKMKYDETNVLFFTIQYYLIHHGWYRGFNFFDDEVIFYQGEYRSVKRLHGSDHGYDYIQFL